MDLELKEKVVIVTGGAKGIGESITRTLAEEGAIPIIFSRNPAEASSLKEELEAKEQHCDLETLELTDFEALALAIQSVLSRYKRIDGVINNAGVNDGVGLDAGPGAFMESLKKNLVQVYAVVHYALPSLKESRGSIINIGSKVAVTGQGGTSAYAAAKGGINSLTREWALDLAKDGIRVNAVIPAEVMTPLYEKCLQRQPHPDQSRKTIMEHIPLGHRFTTAEEIAQSVAFLLSAKSSHTTGQILYVDGGYTHFDRMYERTI